MDSEIHVEFNENPPIGDKAHSPRGDEVVESQELDGIHSLFEVPNPVLAVTRSDKPKSVMSRKSGMSGRTHRSNHSSQTGLTDRSEASSIRAFKLRMSELAADTEAKKLAADTEAKK